MNEGKFQDKLEQKYLNRSEEIRLEVMKNVIDIHRYEGLIQYTQVPNIESLLMNDIKASGSPGWGSKGRMTKGRMGSFEIYLTSKKKESSFLEWEKLTYSKEGQVAILLDISVLEKNRINISTIGHDDPYGLGYIEQNVYSYNDIRELIEADCDIFVIEDQSIPKEAVMGFVLSPNDGHIERKRDAIDDKNEDQIMRISHNQAVELLYKRMERQLRLNPESAHFVPLYDYNGDILWPEKVSYNKIRKKN